MELEELSCVDDGGNAADGGGDSLSEGTELDKLVWCGWEEIELDCEGFSSGKTFWDIELYEFWVEWEHWPGLLTQWFGLHDLFFRFICSAFPLCFNWMCLLRTCGYIVQNLHTEHWWFFLLYSPLKQVWQVIFLSFRIMNKKTLCLGYLSVYLL